MKLLPILLFSSVVLAQTHTLEVLSVQGTSYSKDLVREQAALRLGTQIDKAAIEAACGRLQDSGLFTSIAYKYAWAPKGGYAVTFTLEDEIKSADARIDIPGADEADLWRRLAALSPRFDHKAPLTGSGQEFLARKIGQLAAEQLDGQSAAARMEMDTTTGKSWVSFQPETLPRIAEMTFTGQQQIGAVELTAIMKKVVENYTERSFRAALEMNVRPAYEKQGMYRVRFPRIEMRKTGPLAISVATAIEEGPMFALGEVKFSGENLPAERMMKLAKFKTGDVADWSAIQKWLWEAEKLVKRTGYFKASAVPERKLDDARRVIDLTITFRMGELYRYGELYVIGLPPKQQAQVRGLWKGKTGAPYDYVYPHEFLAEVYNAIGGPQAWSGEIREQTGAGPNVRDITLVFSPRPAAHSQR